MTLNPPEIAPVSVPSDLITFRRVSDVTPFTYRSGMTYTALLESLRDYLINGFVPWTHDEFEEFSESWSENVSTVITAVNTALADQRTEVAANLASTLAEIVAGSNTALNDATIDAALHAAGSTALAYLDGRYAASTTVTEEFATVTANIGTVTAGLAGVKRFYAPDPNGTDDTTALQALFTAMMDSDGVGSGVGEVILGPGVYKGNWIINAGFWSGKIKGRGKQATYLQSLDETHAVLRVNGTSGSISSGSLEDVTIAGTDITATTARHGVGTELNGIGGFHIERVQYTNLDQAHRWMISTPGQFTEFCLLRDINMNYCTHPLTYDGVGSYHGSGVDGNSIVGVVSGGELMLIGAGCNVYNAPLSLTMFTPVGSTAGNAIVNNYAGPVYFYGHFRMEMQGGEYTLGFAGGAYVYYAGEILMWGGPSHLGKLFLVEKVVSTGTTVIPHLKPWNTKQTLNTGTTPIMGGAPIVGPGTYDCEIEVFGPAGYWYSYSVRAWTSGTSVPAVIDILKTRVSNDPGSVGAPTFAWDNGLTITNNNFNTNFSVSASFRCLVHPNPGDNLGQY